jgi:hypothetical protein
VFLVASVLLLLALTLAIPGLDVTSRWAEYMRPRLERFALPGPSENLGRAIVDGLEVFDASAVLFLWDNPEHLLLGAGPGLVSLPASDYVPMRAQPTYGNRIDSIPHMGFFQTLANTGVVGLLLWFAAALACYQALRVQVVLNGTRSPWVEAWCFFVVFSGVYLLQKKPIWYVLMGIGLGASMSLRARRRQEVHGRMAAAEVRSHEEP